jgi:hypothetical protein|uniref:Glycine-zipper-containing OmpA-like membrane domain-containing protein n=1 Tax=Desulfobacca acetoxidans TaxID=60893 RepID=A0A7C5EN08_9BACT
MIRKSLALLVILVFAVTFLGCVTESGYYDPARSAGAGALGGAATGAALGAIIGAATGSPATGAWIGAASGALVGAIGGALYAEHRNQQMRNAAMAAEYYNYTPARGALVEVNEARALPATVRPGQTVDMLMTYTVLTPENAPVQVTLYRDVSMGGRPVGQPYQVQATNQNGTYQDRVGFTVPRDAPPGTYAVRNRVMTAFGTSERTAYFRVVY